MATAWRVAIRATARAVQGIAGAQASTVETNYLTSPLTATQIDSPKYNLSYIQDICINVHGRLALEIASVADRATGIGCHPWRTFFKDVTANIAHGGDFPLVGASGKTIIGAWGRPYDAANTDLLLQPASAERVSNFREYPTVYTTNPSLYHVNGSRVYHTTTNVQFEVCVYERADAVSAVAANGNVSVPDSLIDALVYGSVASALIESEYIDQADRYAQYYNAALAAIRSGSISMPGLPFAAMKGAA